LQTLLCPACFLNCDCEVNKRNIFDVLYFDLKKANLHH